MIVLGIDPGQTGGLAVVSHTNEGPVVLAAVRMPVREVRNKKAFDIEAALAWRLNNVEVVHQGVIEQVSAMPRQGVSSTFQFGRMYGAAETFLQMNSPAWAYVTPTVWKNALGLSSSKGASLDLATSIFGTIARAAYWPLKKDDGVAEAALIAHWWLLQYKKGN